jgi:hypothetical protein
MNNLCTFGSGTTTCRDNSCHRRLGTVVVSWAIQKSKFRCSRRELEYLSTRTWLVQWTLQMRSSVPPIFHLKAFECAITKSCNRVSSSNDLFIFHAGFEYCQMTRQDSEQRVSGGSVESSSPRSSSFNTQICFHAWQFAHFSGL